MSYAIADLVTLNKRTVIVTGAAQGIGRACCDLAYKLGAVVVGIDLNEQGLASVAATEKDRWSHFVGDVSDEDFVQRTCRSIVERHGAIHGLVNNAGILHRASLEDMSIKQWNRMLQVNLTAQFLWLQAAGRDMLRRARAGEAHAGSIVNVSSDAGRRGSVRHLAHYSAAKAGVLGLTMSAAREWARHGVRTNSVCFGPIATPMTEGSRSVGSGDDWLTSIPMGRWGTPEEAVKTICFLLSDAASYTVGQHYAVDGGYHISS